jgi:uncharacterized protein (TIGR02302 family)
MVKPRRLSRFSVLPELPLVVRGRVALSWLVLLSERLGETLWPAVSCLLALLALALSGILLQGPGWLHGAVVICAGGAFGGLLVHGLDRLRWPTMFQAMDRLDCSQPHRPLLALTDQWQPASADDSDLARALWESHQRRMRQAATLVRVHPPRPLLAASDPWALRFIPLLALVLVAPLLHGDALSRIQQTFSFDWARPSAGIAPTVSLWITPPAYTQAAALERTLTANDDNSRAPLVVPQGSQLVMVIHGATAPRIDVGGVMRTPSALDDGGSPPQTISSRLDTTLSASTDLQSLRVLDGSIEVARWPLMVTADHAPSVALRGDLHSDGRQGTLAIPYRAEDDYGITALTAELSRPNQPPRLFPLPLSVAAGSAAAGVGASLDGTALLSLAADRWAGLTVSLRLTATDAAGSMAMTAAETVQLPERAFTHPVAQKITALRRALIDDPATNRAERVNALAAIAADTASYGGQFSVFMALRSAATRLGFGPFPVGWPHVAPPDVLDLLWSAALRIEDGERGNAEQRMLAAQAALDAALANHAGAAEVAERVEALRRAVQDYLRSVFDQMPPLSDADMQALQAIQSLQDSGSDPHAVDPQALDDLLRQLQDLEALGAHDAAAAVRARIEDMLNALRQARPPDAQALKALREGINALMQVITQQKALLEETFQAQKQVSPDRRGQAINLQQRQQQLIRRLETLAQMGGKQTLQRAENAMEDASDALAAVRLFRASEAQQEAMDALQSGAREMMQQMVQDMNRGQGGLVLLPGRMPGGPGAGDPLGQNPGDGGGGKSPIPTEGATSRARDILLELRNRANDPQRSEAEKTYIRRLLQRF